MDEEEKLYTSTKRKKDNGTMRKKRVQFVEQQEGYQTNS